MTPSRKIFLLLSGLLLVIPTLQAMEKQKRKSEDEPAAAASSSSSKAASSSKKQKVANPLVEAIEKNDEACVDELIAASFPINEPDKHGVMPFLHAVKAGHVGIIKKLFPPNFDISPTYAQSIVLACACGNLEVVKLLVERRPHYTSVSASIGCLKTVHPLHEDFRRNFASAGNPHISDLMAAVYCGNLQVVDYLIQRGAVVYLKSLGKYTPLEIAVIKGSAEIVTKLLARQPIAIEPMSQLLQRALENRQYPVAQALATWAASLTNEYRNAALRVASKANYAPVITTIRNAYGDVDPAQNVYINALADTIILTHARDPQVLEDVLNRKTLNTHALYEFVSADSSTTLATPLEYFVRKNNVPVVQLLIRHGTQLPPDPVGQNIPNPAFEFVKNIVMANNISMTQAFFPIFTINRIDHRNKTLLNYVCEAEDCEQRIGMINFLLSSDADVRESEIQGVKSEAVRELLRKEIQRRTHAYLEACKQGDCPTIKRHYHLLPIYCAEREENKTPIELAIEHNRAEAVEFLLPHSALILDHLLDPASEANDFLPAFNQQRADNLCKHILESKDARIPKMIVTVFTGMIPGRFVPALVHAPQLYTLVRHACQTPERLRALLQAGVPANSRLHSPFSGSIIPPERLRELLTLSFASKFRQFFQQSGNPKHAPGMQTPLMIAAGFGNEACVRLLLEHHAYIHFKDAEGKTAFDYATPEIRELLKTSSDNIDASMDQFLNECKTTDNPTPVDLEVLDSKGLSLMTRAVNSNNIRAVRQLLHKNVGFAEACNVLPYAAKRGFSDVVELLLMRGEKLDIYQLMAIAADVALEGHIEVITQLLTHAQNPSEQFSIFTRSFTAALQGQRELLVNHLLVNYPHLLSNCYTRVIPRIMPVNDSFPYLINPLVLSCSLSKNKRLVERVLHAVFALADSANPELAINRRKDLTDAIKCSVREGRLDIFSLLLREKCDILDDNLLGNHFDHELAVTALLDNAQHDIDARTSQLRKRLLFAGCRLAGNICIYAKNLKALVDAFEKLYAEYKPSFARNVPEEQKFQRALEFCGKRISINGKDLRICSALAATCILGKIDLLDRLLKLNIPRAIINEADRYGYTPLMSALIFGNFDCALKLIHDPLLDEKGQHVRDNNGNEIYINHCGKRGLWFVDQHGRNAIWGNGALYYAAQAAIYDIPAVGVLQPGSRDTYDIPTVRELPELAKTKKLTPVSKIYYSLTQGALKVFNELIRCGAKPTSKDPVMVGRLLQDLMAENSSHMVLRVLGRFSQTVKESTPARNALAMLNV